MQAQLPYRLSPEFHELKRRQVIEALPAAGLDALVVCNGVHVAYLTGFFHMTTERPIAVVLTADGETFAVTARLELTHLRERAPWLTDIDVYFDYPQGDWAWLAQRLKDRGLAGRRVGVDLANQVVSDAVEGYETLRAVLGDGVRNAHDLIRRLRYRKEPEEIEIMRLACAYCDDLVGFAFDSLEDGVTEYEIHRRAEDMVIRKMIAELPQIIDFNGYQRGLVAGRTLFAGSSAFPHGPKGTRRLQPDDIVMITYGTAVCSYMGETERTGFYGRRRPVDEDRFKVMLETQNAAIEAMVPGNRCCDVFEAAAAVVRRYGLEDALQHHVGHGKGLESHEHPFLDPGDETVLEPGMLFSCEPGLYFPGEAGFRHSDTILVTANGPEILTRYPRDLAALTFERRPAREGRSR